MDNVLGQSSSSWDQQSCLELSFSSHISTHPHSKVAEFLGTDPQFGRTSYSKRVKGQKEGLVTSSTTSQPPDGPTVKVREAIDHLPKNQRREATRAAEFTWALAETKTQHTEQRGRHQAESWAGLYCGSPTGLPPSPLTVSPKATGISY